MLYLIHGDQSEAARKKLTELKGAAAGKEVREVNGKKLDGPVLTQALESSSMFGGDVLVAVEGFLTHAKKREKSFATNLTKFITAAQSIDVILYEEKEIDKATIPKLGSTAKVFLFKTPVVLFQFLDSLRPSHAKYTIPLFQKVVATEPAEIVFVMILRRVRQLIQVKDNVTPDKMQSWQMGRLTTQAKTFTMDELVAMHKALLQIDIAIKTGSSAFTLAQHIQQLLISL